MYGTRSTVPVKCGSSETGSPQFHDFFNSFFAPQQGPAATMNPALDVVENAEGYVLRLDLPGLTQDKVNVHFANNVLTIQGEKSGESIGDEDRLHVVERTRGSFARSVKFPTNVDAARVKAGMKHGVLTVVVPKAEAAKTQKITVVEE